MEYEFHRELKQDVVRFLQRNAYKVNCEIPLPNNKIADVIAHDIYHKIIIVEVKSTLRRFHFPEAWEKYQPYCNGLYIATVDSELKEYEKQLELLDWSQPATQIGLLAIARHDVTIVRTAQPNRLPKDRTHEVLQRVASQHPVW